MALLRYLPSPLQPGVADPRAGGWGVSSMPSHLPISEAGRERQPVPGCSTGVLCTTQHLAWHAWGRSLLDPSVDRTISAAMCPALCLRAGGEVAAGLLPRWLHSHSHVLGSKNSSRTLEFPAQPQSRGRDSIQHLKWYVLSLQLHPDLPKATLCHPNSPSLLLG